MISSQIICNIQMIQSDFINFIYKPCDQPFVFKASPPPNKSICLPSTAPPPNSSSPSAKNLASKNNQHSKSKITQLRQHLQYPFYVPKNWNWHGLR